MQIKNEKKKPPGPPPGPPPVLSDSEEETEEYDPEKGDSYLRVQNLTQNIESNSEYGI